MIKQGSMALLFDDFLPSAALQTVFYAGVLYKGQMICNSETTYMMTSVELGKRQRF